MVEVSPVKALIVWRARCLQLLDGYMLDIGTHAALERVQREVAGLGSYWERLGP